ncbi:hypothetical protein [Thalassospira lohafexi]|uniref:Capsule biosynthesis protein n=1 Tax=Thalassospira lohafexi TaxID=744227 RepID=A0A2N3LB63_9PROT|nr:hypothetical protein [Thalassospira lohafexi]PKR60044.1 hypothetical protein COO92_01335 [Thalassospira lohafexi]
MKLLNNLKKTVGKFQSELQRKRIMKDRIQFDSALLDLIDETRPNSKPNISAFIDCTWENPHFWYRTSLLVSALNIELTSSVGYIGYFRHREISSTLKAFGISNKKHHKQLMPPVKDVTELANDLIAKTTSPNDIVEWKLPFDFPGTVFYDTLLKAQKTGFVDHRRHGFKELLITCLQSLIATRKALESSDSDIVICSHNIGEIAAPLAWHGLQLNKQVYILYGDFGGQRFQKVNSVETFLRCIAPPTRSELDNSSTQQKTNLIRNGTEYLAERFAGQAGDIASALAYTGENSDLQYEEMLSACNWTSDKPLISIYMQNWFDFPHSLGLERFRDFYDWIEATFAVIREQKNVNWLIRAHPLDERYGVTENESVRSMVKALDLVHIKSCPSHINSMTVIKKSTGIITACGSIGLEATCHGTPVLVAEKAWYGEHGFVIEPGSRSGYLTTLTRAWWTEVDTKKAKEYAARYSGFYFGYPDWQKGLIHQDDSQQFGLYPGLMRLMNETRGQIRTEILTLRAWSQSSSTQYHTYKNLRANDYVHASMSNSLLSN